MEKEPIIERIRTIAGHAAAASDIELVHIDIGGTKRDVVVRIYIDKVGGVTLEDCSAISRDVEAVLDEEDFIPSRYVLEVSSPGIERELYSLGDYQKFSGQLIKLKTKETRDGQRTFVGELVGVDGDTITIDDRTKGLITFDYKDIDRANLKIDLSKEFKGR
ncbi:ribosome maturation factor RimP [soil metagenome]